VSRRKWSGVVPAPGCAGEVEVTRLELEKFGTAGVRVTSSARWLKPATLRIPAGWALSLRGVGSRGSTPSVSLVAACGRKASRR
jgi:hypothetical protein